ncbi:MAG: apolipoprotein N-acyltransferase [Deltaproteobacteria bacterium]|nr:MAG: apolipoprotein N-acyltransferase [Deltaproteobacteria bacterium]
MFCSYCTTAGYLILFASMPLWLILVKMPCVHGAQIVFVFKFLEVFILTQWLGVGMSLYGEFSLILAVIISFLYSLIVACYFSFGYFFGKIFCDIFQWDFRFIIPVFMSFCEFVKTYGYLLFPIPWGDSVYVLSGVPVMLQLVSIFGAFGVGFFIFFIGASFAFKRYWQSLFFFSLWIFFGGVSLQSIHCSLKELNVGVYQANIGCSSLSKLKQEEAFLRYYGLYQVANNCIAQDFYIWPENPSFSAHDQRMVESFMQKNVQMNIVTMPVICEDYGFVKVFNSALVFVAGKIKMQVNKEKLIPFGEYSPRFLEFIRLADEPFCFGSGAKIYREKDLNFGITICFEGLFPELGVSLRRAGAEFLINSTNDGWFGETLGPHLHFSAYQIRAVETAASYIRAANSGISAWIDPHGYVHSASNLYESSFLRLNVVSCFMETMYSIMGDFISRICVCIYMVSGLIVLKRVKGIV